MWKFLSESNFIGKILLYGLVCLLIWFMQARLERTQKIAAQKEEQCRILQQVNKNQQESITKLLQEHAKQEELIVQAKQEKEKLMQEYRTKQTKLHKSTDTASTNWKKTPLPENILQIIKQK